MKDSAIIKLFWMRDERAIAETDTKYGAYCYQVADNILCSRQDSEECVSDTWFQAWNAMPPQKPEYLRLFLAKITRNLAFNRYRQRHTQKHGGKTIVIRRPPSRPGTRPPMRILSARTVPKITRSAMRCS